MFSLDGVHTKESQASKDSLSQSFPSHDANTGSCTEFHVFLCLQGYTGLARPTGYGCNCQPLCQHKRDMDSVSPQLVYLHAAGDAHC
jgi:hypothetical protein